MEFFNQLGQGLQTLKNFGAQTILGADYVNVDPGDKPRDPRTRKQRLGEAGQQLEKRAQRYRVGQEMPAGTEMRGSQGRVPTVSSQYAPVAPKPTAPSAGTVNASPIASPINPQPTAGRVPRIPKPSVNNAPSALGPMGGVRGGLIGAAVQIGSELAIPHITREATRGARMLAGDPNYNTPVWLKSVNGTNYDVRTSGGKNAYWKAKAAERNAPTPDPSPTKGSVVRMGGVEYSMNDPKQKAAYDVAQKAELERQRSRSPMADIRGGDGLKDAKTNERFSPPPAPRSTPAPKDPNNTGARGTSMSYQRFMDDIGTKNNVNVRDPFSSENLPGTAGFGASFYLNSGANQQSFKESMAVAKVVGKSSIPEATINSAEMGQMASMLENQRQLTPGEGSFPTNAPNLGVGERQSGKIDTTITQSAGSTNSPENLRLRARAALLGEGHVMDNMRRAEGEMGLISQGGKKFARDTGAESGLREITQDAYRARMGGGSMVKDNPIASAAKGKGQARLTASGAGSQTAATEAPSDVENPAVIGEDNKVEIIDRSDKMHGARTNFTVPTDQIPKNLKGAAGQAYLKKLDARKLTR